MKYDGVKEMFRNIWSEKFNYLCIEWSKNKKKVNIVCSVETKTHKLIVFAKVKLFSFLNVASN